MSILKKTGTGLKYRICLELPNGSDLQAFVRKVDLYEDLERIGSNRIFRSNATGNVFCSQDSVIEHIGADTSKMVLYIGRNENVDEWLRGIEHKTIRGNCLISSGYMINPDMPTQRTCLNGVALQDFRDDLMVVTVDCASYKFE